MGPACRAGLAIALGTVLTWTVAAASSIKSDEEVYFFPTAGCADPAASVCALPVHGWIYEPEEASLARSAFVKALAVALGVEGQSLQDRLFQKRVWMFIVDNERWKRLRVRAGGKVFPMGWSSANGHFTGQILLARPELAAARQGDWLPFEAVTRPEDPRRFPGSCLVLAPEGVSVISDIDDTIKDSNVLDKKELLANTFMRPFRPVSGMAESYRAWAAAGCAFHYVSGSPWQLARFLSDFLEENRFPRGSFHLRSVRLKDETLLNLLRSPLEQKIEAIGAILRTFPRRRFLLVGDSGEADPEVYGRVARENPGRVLHAFIREVAGGRNDQARFQAAFRDLPPNLWTVFRDPAVLAKSGLPLKAKATPEAAGK